MALTNTALIKLVSDLTTSDISDIDLTSMIKEAERQFWKDISVRQEWETPDGSIDGSRTEFQVQKYPISPTQSSPTVAVSDITVYGIHTNATTGFDETTELTVSSLVARDGRFTLSTAPDPDTYDELKTNYSFTGVNIDWDLVSLAVAYATAFLVYGGKFTQGEYENVKFKDLSISQGSKSTDNKSKSDSMLEGYNRTLASLRPRRFRNRKIRSETFKSAHLRGAKRSTQFEPYHTALR